MSKIKIHKLAKMHPLTHEEAEDAAFRVRDRLWAEIADLFDKLQEEHGLTYADLGRRIGRSRSQVQRWLDAPINMTMSSAGLLIEGLNADIEVRICERLERLTNRAHPCDEAAAHLVYRTYLHTDRDSDLVEVEEDAFLLNEIVDLEDAPEGLSWNNYEVA